MPKVRLQKELENIKRESEAAFQIREEFVRWDNVKTAHDLVDDMEVARMLLDCYDLIGGNFLVWSDQAKLAPPPLHATLFLQHVSEEGWEVLQEIKALGGWRQDKDKDKTEPEQRKSKRKQARVRHIEPVQVKQEVVDPEDGEDRDSQDDDYVPSGDDDDDFVPEEEDIQPKRLTKMIRKPKSRPDRGKKATKKKVAQVEAQESDDDATEDEEKDEEEETSPQPAQRKRGRPKKREVRPPPPPRKSKKKKPKPEEQETNEDLATAELQSTVIRTDNEEPKTLKPIPSHGRRTDSEDPKSSEPLPSHDKRTGSEDPKSSEPLPSHDKRTDSEDPKSSEPLPSHDKRTGSEDPTSSEPLPSHDKRTDSEDLKSSGPTPSHGRGTDKEDPKTSGPTSSHETRIEKEDLTSDQKPRRVKIRWPKGSEKTYTRTTITLYQCKQCSTICESFGDFKIHYETHAESQESAGIKPVRGDTTLYTILYRCKLCGKLINEFEIERHRAKHTEVVNKVCDLCGKTFTVRGSWHTHLHMHEAEKTGNRWACKICGKIFHLRNALTSHMKYHSTERPHVCEVCGKSFKIANALRRHHRVHETTKPYACQFCGKGFNQKYNLKGHVRTHTGEKPFQCDMCSAAFTHNGSLKCHKKTAHGIDMSKDKKFLEFDEINLRDPKMYEKVRIKSSSEGTSTISSQDEKNEQGQIHQTKTSLQTHRQHGKDNVSIASRPYIPASVENVKSNLPPNTSDIAQCMSLTTCTTSAASALDRKPSDSLSSTCSQNTGNHATVNAGNIYTNL
ncbi:uncharacterized protein [Amphiura filiformis]|uniref:uncharacterized protein isoform X1 n=1 Tax=Amphiura filiformis TaxID=82378 RepID=UPI003B214787